MKTKKVQKNIPPFTPSTPPQLYPFNLPLRNLQWEYIHNTRSLFIMHVYVFVTVIKTDILIIIQ